MNPTLESIIQAEIDGLASEEEIQTLTEAAASDPEIRALRDDYRRIALDISGLQTFTPPPGMTDRIMAALPAPRPVVTLAPTSILGRLSEIFRSAFAADRRQVAFAFALGVVVTFGMTVMLQQPAGSGDPRTGTLVGATSASDAIASLPFDGLDGRVEVQAIPQGHEIRIIAPSAAAIRIEVDAAGADVALVAPDAGIETRSIRRADGVIEFSASIADQLTIRTDASVSVGLVVQIDDSVVFERGVPLNDG